MSRQLSTRQTTIVTKLRKRFRRHEPLTQPASAIPRAVQQPKPNRRDDKLFTS
jgi:hypothetical protein